jgi:hypothetical protein
VLNEIAEKKILDDALEGKMLALVKELKSNWI